MSRVFNGSSQYLSASSTLLSNEPIGLFCWANPSNITATGDVISLGNNGASGNYRLPFRGAVAGDPVSASKSDDAGTNNQADSSTGYSASTWQNGAAAFRSDTSRDAYLNGSNKGSNTTSISDPTPDFITVGALRRSTISTYFPGSIAEVFIFDYAPTDAEQTLLGKGIHPLDVGIPGVNIRGWYPLINNDNNHMANGYPNLTPSGSPTLDSHPSLIVYPRIGAVIGM